MLHIGKVKLMTDVSSALVQLVVNNRHVSWN